MPLNPHDHISCVRLANDAVHTAMRGYTGVCVGAMHNVISMLPCRLEGNMLAEDGRIGETIEEGLVTNLSDNWNGPLNAHFVT